MSSPVIIDLTKASIHELKHALATSSMTSVELVSRYLHRIAKYDMRGPGLNSVPVINYNVMEEAQVSDNYRASGKPPRPLEGIPFTVKDSFRVRGMTVAAGSPAFQNLIAPDDAFVVQLLRQAGAIVLDGGNQRGLYDRAESPYNLEHSTTAFYSGSSSGCGTSTTASFAAFGLAGETVSSGRAPASNNALVGYSPSRGVIPLRGQWPLYPTCDVVVPHTKSLPDLFDILNEIVADDPGARDLDFWRGQKFVPIPLASTLRPLDYHMLEDASALQGKRIAVPKCFLGTGDRDLISVCSPDVTKLFQIAVEDLRTLGATVVETDFPLLEQYAKQDFPGQSINVPGLSKEWTSLERCQLMAMGWDDFLRDLNDPQCPNLTHVDMQAIHPHIAPLDDPSGHSASQNQVRYSEMLEEIRIRGGSTYDLPACRESLQALEDFRTSMYDDWMDSNCYDLLAFPTNGDVSRADADENIESMLHALQTGINYANGGRALKHLGIPCITVPMGEIEGKKMPVGITFSAKGWADSDLLRYAFAYENATKRRTTPRLAPHLTTDFLVLDIKQMHTPDSSLWHPSIQIDTLTSEKCNSASESIWTISVSGSISTNNSEISIKCIEAYVDGEQVHNITLEGDHWTYSGDVKCPMASHKYPALTQLPRDKVMFTVLVKASNGRAASQFRLVDLS
ncbi:hypothetical protein E4T49_07984 [Aureobasidium sp. EXF-10728]|nr:hypothetical protein E4T49_07984 [Aureobasidium sp. EXF-10728]